MTTYRFCVAPGGTLVCYKVNNGFIKFSGSYAHQLLEHIKDFSFYTFNSYIKEENNKYTCDITFDSNNHQIIFEDIHKLKNKGDISIEKEIKELVNIVNENKNIQREMELQEIREKKQSLIKKKMKALLYAATVSTTVLVSSKSNLEVVKAETITDPNVLNNNMNPAVTSETGEVATVPTSLETEINPSYIGPVLNKQVGVIHNGPAGGDESFYDLNMTRVVKTMRDHGFDKTSYPYWEREDGVKMLGNFVMVAANLEVHPRGSVVQTSLGMGLVCDTGAFAKTNKLKLDIATNWTKNRPKKIDI